MCLTALLHRVVAGLQLSLHSLLPLPVLLDAALDGRRHLHGAPVPLARLLRRGELRLQPLLHVVVVLAHERRGVKQRAIAAVCVQQLVAQLTVQPTLQRGELDAGGHHSATAQRHSGRGKRDE